MSDDIHDQPTGAGLPGGADFDVEVRESFEAVLDRFEAAWQSGEPDIVEYARARPGDDALLVELCLVDLAHRHKRGLPASLDAYTARYPALADRLRELAAIPSATESSLRGRAAADLVGREIGDVAIVRLIGEGGMGRVYEGRQRKPRRPVAVKVMQPGVASPALLKRFEYEAQVLARLQHPGIAHIYAVGIHEIDGQTMPYFVMEYIPNAKTLTQYAEERKLSTHERLALFQKVCDAVAHGHQKGVIHRDIKPANVVVDSTGQPKVIDFGVAKATDSDLALTTMQTDVGAIIGTLQYMSPEQFDADPDDLDVRLDVYALGVVLYELLTGKPPYDVRRKAIYEVARVVREEEPTPITSLDKTLRRDVAVIAGKCLEKDRTRRYSSAAELAGDVGRYLVGEPITAAPPGFWDGVTRLARRHKAAAVAVAGIAASLVAAVVGISAFAVRAERARAEAARQTEVAIRERTEAGRAREAERQRAESLKKVADFQSQMLERIDATAAGRSLMTDIRERLTAALEKAGVPADERATQADTLGRLLDRVNATDTAAALIDRTLIEPAIATIDARFEDDPQTAASLRQALANVYRALGLYEASLPLQQRALDDRRRVLGDDHPDTLTSIGTMGVLLQSQGKLAEAEPFYRESLERYRRVFGEEHRHTLVSTSNLGGLLRAQGRFGEAEPLIRDALERFRRVLGEDHPHTLVSITVMGVSLYAQGKFAEAEPFLREALEKKRRTLGADHPHTLTALNNLAGLLRAQGKLAEAEPFLSEALERHRRVLGDEHPDTLVSISNVAGLFHAQGKLAEAELLYREGLDRHRRILGENHPQTLMCINNAGSLLQARGKLAEADALFAETIRSWRRAFPRPHPTTAMLLHHHADVLRETGRLDEAEKLAREAVAMYREHPDWSTNEARHAEQVLATILDGAVSKP